MIPMSTLISLSLTHFTTSAFRKTFFKCVSRTNRECIRKTWHCTALYGSFQWCFTHPGLHPARVLHNQASVAKTYCTLPWQPRGTACMGQRLAGPVWLRESEWCVAVPAQPSWGPHSFVSGWDHRSPDAAEMEEEVVWVSRGGGWRVGNWCGKKG